MTREVLDVQTTSISESYVPMETNIINDLARSFANILEQIKHQKKAIDAPELNDNIVGVGLTDIEKMEKGLPENLTYPAYLVMVYHNEDKRVQLKRKEKGLKFEYISVDYYLINENGQALVLKKFNKGKPIPEMTAPNFGFVPPEEKDFKLLENLANSMLASLPVKSGKSSKFPVFNASPLQKVSVRV